MTTTLMNQNPICSRTGSILLLCIAIMVTLAVIAAGFVKLVQLHQANGRDESRYLLSREAAVMGRNQAIEQIVIGYIEEPFTRLDGPAFAPFQSLNNPGTLSDAHVAPSRLDVDDRPAADPNFAPLTANWGGWGYTFCPWLLTDGWFETDGRGRYIEPEFYNPARGYLTTTSPVDIAPAVTAPTTTVRFGAPVSGLPARNRPLLLDERLCRIPGSPLMERAGARYRLRFCENVIDLDGALLMNPDPAIQPDRIQDTDPSSLPALPIPLLPGEGASQPANPDLVSGIYPRIVRAANAWYNMQFVWTGLSETEPDNCAQSALARAEHTFLGRGFSSNFDQRLPLNHSATAADYAPVTWPLMYRAGGNPDFFKMDEHVLNARVADSLYTDTGVTGTKVGGELIPPDRISSALPAKHALVGPQFSFKNADNASSVEWIGGPYDLGVRVQGGLTPFGRGLLQRRASVYKQQPSAQYDRSYERYFGDVDVPWCVNPMTAAPRAITAMILGYMPTGVIQEEIWYADHPTQSPPVHAGTYCNAIRGIRDLFVPQMNLAFQAYLAPTRTLLDGSIIAPDYHLPCDIPADNVTTPADTRAGYRTPAQRYPGPIAFNGFTPASILVHDNLGYYLRMKTLTTPGQPAQRYSLPPPADPHTGIAFWFERAYGGNNGGVTPSYEALSYDPTALKTQPLYDNSVTRVNPSSLWSAIGQALCSAVAVARGQWLQFPTAMADPAGLFSAMPDQANPVWGPWPASLPKVHSVQDLDALFLANLGIDIANPSGPPVPVWGQGPNTAQGKQTMYAYTPQFNVASLAKSGFFAGNDPSFPDPSYPPVAYDASLPTYTPAQRAAVMELVINDVRLSLFGASPGYLGTFLPLDLDGDGKVLCSGYPRNPQASPLEINLHLDQFAAPGTPVATPFSLTGCFWIGKSRYYRILSRGQVWDNLVQAPCSQCLLDTVVCVDPADEAHELGAPGTQKPARQYSTHIMYQRTWTDKYRGDMARNY